MRRVRNLLPLLLVVVVVLAATACGGQGGSGQTSESQRQQSNYNRLVAQDPAHTMTVSPTRKTINFWIDTWGHDPDKLSYVYLEQADGSYGYYIFKGLPVNYCVSLTPNYKIIYDGDAPKFTVPAPSIDGVYYSGGGCQSFYGRDATNNAYQEYTVGTGQNVHLSDRPLPYQHVVPLGFTTLKEVHK